MIRAPPSVGMWRSGNPPGAWELAGGRKMTRSERQKAIAAMAMYEMSRAISSDLIIKSRSRRDISGGILRDETAEASRPRSFSTRGRPSISMIRSGLGIEHRERSTAIYRSSRRPSRTKATISSVVTPRSMPSTCSGDSCDSSGVRTKLCPSCRRIRTDPSLRACSRREASRWRASEYV
jgi:hypothetical protein